MTTEEKQTLAEGLPPDALANLIDDCHSVHFDQKEELIHVYYIGISTEADGSHLTLSPAITFSACDILECQPIGRAMRDAWHAGRCYDVPMSPHLYTVSTPSLTAYNIRGSGGRILFST